MMPFPDLMNRQSQVSNPGPLSPLRFFSAEGNVAGLIVEHNVNLTLCTPLTFELGKNL